MLTDVIKAIDELSPDQLRQLREYIEQREREIELHAGTLDIDTLLRGLDDMRAGLTDTEFRDIERAMKG